MSDIDNLRWVTITQAVGEIQKTERTIRRWVTIGKIPSRREGRKLFVGLPAIEKVEQAEPEPLQDTETLKARLDAQQALIEQLTGERDYLRQILAASVTQQKLIQSSPRRTFWQRIFGSD